MAAKKFPPHTFTDPPARWAFHAGGAVSHVPDSKSIACERCRDMDRRLSTIAGEFKGGIKSPPLHPYCRCVVVAWLERWGDFKGEVPGKDDDGRDTVRKADKHDPRNKAPLSEQIAEANRAKAERRKPATSVESGALRENLGWTYDAGTSERERMLKREGKRRVGVPQSNIDRSTPPMVSKFPGRAPEAPTEIPIYEKKKNPKRVEAAKKAAAASVERRAEIHSAAKSNLPSDLHVAWDKEGHKFMQQQARRIKGVKDRINAASKISEAFMETYGSGEQTVQGNEGDRFYKRAIVEAEHAEKWADAQERKYYEAARKAEERATSKPGKPKVSDDDWASGKADDDDVPF